MVRLEDVLKMSWRRFSRRLEDILKTSWRRFEDVFETSWRRLEDVWETFLQDVLKTSWKRFEDVLARRLEDALKTYSEDKYIGLDQDVLKTSSSRRMFAGKFTKTIIKLTYFIQ